MSREWYQILAKQIFNPDYALFARSAEGTSFQPFTAPLEEDSHRLYKFVGTVIGKALFDGQLFDAHFTRSFYKHILGHPIVFTDIEAIDPEYYKNLKWILENDIDTAGLDQTFSFLSTDFGSHKVIELKPGGQLIQVVNHKN